MWITGGLERDGCDQDEPGARAFVVAGVSFRVLVEELLVVGLELLDPTLARVRLIPAEEAEERVGPEGGQRVVEPRVVARPLAEGDLIAGPAEVANDELLVREPGVEQCLEVAEQVHPLGGRVADQGDPLALHEFQGDLARRQIGAFGPGLWLQ